MKVLMARRRTLSAEGAPPRKRGASRLSIDLDMFSRGGLAVLDAIEASGYDTLHERPSIGKGKQARLLGRALVTHLVARDPKPAARNQEEIADSVAQSYEECHRIARSSHSNFYYAFFLL